MDKNDIFKSFFSIKYDSVARTKMIFSNIFFPLNMMRGKEQKKREKSAQNKIVFASVRTYSFGTWNLGTITGLEPE